MSICEPMVFSHTDVRGSIVLLPLGSFEDHGREAMILDTFLSLEASCRAAELCGWLVAWPLGYGFSPEHRYSVSLGEDDVARLAVHVARGLASLGARRVVIVDGHYGHREAVRRAAEPRGIGYVNLWDLLAAKGYEGFGDQLAFEEKLGALLRGESSEAAETLEMLAEEICSSTRDGGR